MMILKKYLPILKESVLFRGIAEEEIESMFHCLSEVKRCYKKGEIVFQRGYPVSAAALLLDGCVHIQKEDYWGNLSILHEISQGEVFGEVYACLKDQKMQNYAVAVSDSTVLFLDINRVLSVCSSACVFHHRLIRNLLFVMASRTQALTQKLEHMSQKTTREKLLSYLSAQSLKAGSTSFSIPFNRQQLADYLSVDRSAMSNELCKMRKEGILVFDRNYFQLKDLK